MSSASASLVSGRSGQGIVPNDRGKPNRTSQDPILNSSVGDAHCRA
jgi:hypothetical protein